MSYQSTTPKFDLPQWVYTDPPQMNDFNTAFSNIDSKAQPQTEARSTLVKADASGALVAAVEGTDYNIVMDYNSQLIAQAGYNISELVVQKIGKKVLFSNIITLSGSGKFSLAGNHVATIPDEIKPPRATYYIPAIAYDWSNNTYSARLTVGSDRRVFAYTDPKATVVTVNAEYYLA